MLVSLVSLDNSGDPSPPEKIDIDTAEIIACSECDLLFRLSPLEHGVKACCPRCGYVITQSRKNARQKTLAFAITAAIFLLMSLPFSFLSLDSRGTSRMVSLLDSFQSIASYDYTSLAIILFATTIVIPALFLCGLIYVLLSSIKQRLMPMTRSITRVIFALMHWNMAEIFLLGVLISFIKIMSLARVSFGLSFYAYLLFIVSLMTTINYLDRYQLWRWVCRNDR